MFEIISFSDPSTLSMVFNAIASIFGSVSFSSAAALVSVIMLFFFSITTLHDGKREIPFLKWFVGLIAFSLGFMTTVDVSIVDVRTERTTLVSNVPIAIAAPASVISSIGYRFTEMTETAFGNVDGQRITTSGYLSPLVMMAYFKNSIDSSSCLFGSDDVFIENGIKVCPSYRNYARDCTAIKFAREKDSSVFSSALDVLETIFFESDSHNTRIINADGSSREETCRKAFPSISAAMSSSNFYELSANLRGMVGDPESTKPIMEQIDTSLKAISAQSKNSRDLVLALYTRNVVENATQSNLISLNETGMAENFASSTYMRDYSWALQGSLWVDIVDKFLRLIETLIYAVAPFVGLLLLTGSSGFKTFTMYAQVLIVLQLIPIMLVIVQNIILVEAERIHDSLLSSYDNIYSMEMVYRFVREMNELAGLGGMIASTVVPALALALVTGSTFALSGALRSAAEPGKDSDAAPNQVKRGGFIHDISNQSTTKLTGDYKYTQEQANYLVDIAGSEAVSSLVSNAQNRLDNAQEVLSFLRESATSMDFIDAFTTNEAQAFGSRVLGGSSTTDSIILSMVHAASKSMKITEEEAQEFAAMFSLGAHLPKKGLGKKDLVSVSDVLGFSGGVEWSNQKTNSNIIAELGKTEEGRALIDRYNSAVQNQDDLISKDSETHSYSIKYLESKSKKIQDAKAEVESISIELSKAKSVQKNFEINTPEDKWLMYQNLAKDSFIQDNLNKVYDFIDNKKESGDYTDKESANRFFDNFNTAYRVLDSPLSNISDEQIFTGAMFYAMSITRGMDPSLFAFALTGDESYLDIKSGIGGFTGEDVKAINRGLYDNSDTSFINAVNKEMQGFDSYFEKNNYRDKVDHWAFSAYENYKKEFNDARSLKVEELIKKYPYIEEFKELEGAVSYLTDESFSQILSSGFRSYFDDITEDFSSLIDDMKDAYKQNSLANSTINNNSIQPYPGLLYIDPERYKFKLDDDLIKKALLLLPDNELISSLVNGEVAINKKSIGKVIEALEEAKKYHELSWAKQINEFLSDKIVSYDPFSLINEYRKSSKEQDISNEKESVITDHSGLSNEQNFSNKNKKEVLFDNPLNLGIDHLNSENKDKDKDKDNKPRDADERNNDKDHR